jgi:hypothetical protein
MKDLYSFHAEQEDLDSYYEKLIKAYTKIFKEVGLGKITYRTLASGGSFSKYSDEFQTITEAGEDIIYICKKCGIAPNEIYGVLRDPLDEVVKVDISGLAHAMLNRVDRRERYIRYIRETIENPYEVLLTEYEAGITGNTKFRKKYIGLFRETQKEAVVVIAEATQDGTVLWNVMNAKKGTIDRIRNGVEVLYGK